MSRKYHITFDIDWASDCSIEMCLSYLKECGVKATFFATHHTDLNKEIVQQGHELGIHPNFLPSSSQGGTCEEIIETCLEYAPDARYIRTHALVQSTPLLCEIFSKFPQLEADVSLLMHRAKYCQRCVSEFQDVTFDRILYNWEDDAEFKKKRFSTDEEKFFGELTIYDFHPIHVHLNSLDAANYNLLKASLRGRSLHQVSKKTISKYMNRGIGVRSFFLSVVNSGEKSITLDEV